ncbi:hypothetical protein J2S57_006547 [Kineosporia succinea]|uniref:Uncharacterized protein n=1 Tax=Kineosporia succinea TaxID=84632 RepID=A0ABT9PDK8_9ACTN|nr:hypothetical protein [Kineosporia succinea]
MSEMPAIARFRRIGRRPLKAASPMVDAVVARAGVPQIQPMRRAMAQASWRLAAFSLVIALDR